MAVISASYRIDWFELSARFAGGADLVVYKGIDPYLQWGFMPELRGSFFPTEIFGIYITLGYGWTSVYDL